MLGSSFDVFVACSARGVEQRWSSGSFDSSELSSTVLWWKSLIVLLHLFIVIFVRPCFWTISRTIPLYSANKASGNKAVNRPWQRPIKCGQCRWSSVPQKWCEVYSPVNMTRLCYSHSRNPLNTWIRGWNPSANACAYPGKVVQGCVFHVKHALQKKKTLQGQTPGKRNRKLHWSNNVVSMLCVKPIVLKRKIQLIWKLIFPLHFWWLHTLHIWRIFYTEHLRRLQVLIPQTAWFLWIMFQLLKGQFFPIFIML